MEYPKLKKQKNKNKNKNKKKQQQQQQHQQFFLKGWILVLSLSSRVMDLDNLGPKKRRTTISIFDRQG